VWRLGAVFGLFSAVRCTVRRATPSDLVASVVAGAVAVGLPTAVMRERQVFLRGYYASVLSVPKEAVPLGVVVASSMLSGGATFGLGDWALRKGAGIDW
jgi:hypothetical protein